MGGGPALGIGTQHSVHWTLALLLAGAGGSQDHGLSLYWQKGAIDS